MTREELQNALDALAQEIKAEHPTAAACLLTIAGAYAMNSDRELAIHMNRLNERLLADIEAIKPSRN